MFVPFQTYIVKICSRCNINCDYCFVYNKADQGWKSQPKLMSSATMRQVARRIREHCERHSKQTFSLIFHGGEPLLGGVQHLTSLVTEIEEEFRDSMIEPKLGIQSNGLLFNEEIGDFLLEKKIQMGISVDGPPKINDLHRVDRKGRGTSSLLERKLRLLLSDRFKTIFGGFLVVINPDGDPIELIDYLANFNPQGFDFILPYDNHSRLPYKKRSFEDTTYGDWLVRAFDYWYQSNSHVEIREFHGIIRMLFHGRSTVESIGTGPVELVVVETNGDIEAVDSLKASMHGATKLGLNVFDDTFDDAAQCVEVQVRHIGAAGLCSYCQGCSIVDLCGGGYLPNRYSEQNGFDNPSIFCRDLSKLIYHVADTVQKSLKQSGMEHAVNTL